MPLVQINDIELFYTVQGTGEPLLLIAGFNSDHFSWAAMMSVLVKQYQVIRMDNRGTGQSSAPDRPYSIADLAADAIALLNHLAIPTAHIVGHSMGGQIAQAIALSAPNRVKTLTLLSSWAEGDRKFHDLIELFGDLPSQLDPILYQKTLLPWLFTEAFYETGAIAQLITVLENYPYLSTPQALYHQSRAILNSNTVHELANIPHPTLILVGQHDLITPVAFSQQLAQGIPHSKLVILDQVGHALIVEAAQATARELLQFLANPHP